MPELNTIIPVEYRTFDPYHVDYDNLPLRNIVNRQTLINYAVDINSEILRDSTGTQLTLADRLDISLEPDGKVKSSAVDTSLHNIAYHEDGTDGTTEYVRMEQAERDKLDLISDEATALRIRFPTASVASVIQEFADETIEIENSTSISWEVYGTTVQAITNFPIQTWAHQHYYGLEPVHDDLVTPDYMTYRTTTGAVPRQFVAGTLRVFISGVRIFSDADVYVPRPDNSASDLIRFTPATDRRGFTLSRAISDVACTPYVCRIDFDEAQG